jgi:hypothetical protein
MHLFSQRRATRDEGGNERGLKQLCTSPGANTLSPADTAASAAEAPTQEHSRQESSTQQQKQSGDKRTRSRMDPGDTACKHGAHPQSQNGAHPQSQNAVLGESMQPRYRHQTKDLRNKATNLEDPGNDVQNPRSCKGNVESSACVVPPRCTPQQYSAITR